MKQATIQHTTTLEGIGLHTGKAVKMTFRPAAEQYGIRFQRTDLPDQPIIAADAARVVSTTRGTTIRVGEAQVSTVEHCLSALIGLAIDNIIIEIDGPEVPIMDGTAVPFWEKVEAAGRVEQEAEREGTLVHDVVVVDVGGRAQHGSGERGPLP